jgi:hypothetical protein
MKAIKIHSINGPAKAIMKRGEESDHLDKADNASLDENDETKIALREKYKDSIKASFNAFLKSVAYKDGWFEFQTHPTDTHIRVKDIDDVVSYLIRLIAKLVSSYLFNEKTSFHFNNHNNKEEVIDLLTIEGTFIFSLNCYFLIILFFYLIKN